MNLLTKIKAFLDEHQVHYTELEHKPTPTSEESAKARGVSMKSGAKALLVKGKKGFVLCVMPADRRLDAKKVKKAIKSSSLRFATPEELKQITDCEKGAMPPFGHFFNIPLIVDPKLFEEEYIDFNAGSLMHSLKIASRDYERVTQPRKEDITQN